MVRLFCALSLLGSIAVSQAPAFANTPAKKPAAPAAQSAFKNEKDQVSYIIGHQIGTNLERNGVDVNMDIFLTGLKDALAKKDSKINQEETQKIMEAYQTKLAEVAETKRKEVGDKNSKDGKTFLEANKKKKGVVTLPSGLQYVVEKEGKGNAPKATDTVTVHYRGTLIDGKEFDSSYGRGEPATFPVNGVIKGWTEALQLMKPGSKYKLFIPSELAYGETGAGPDIGPNATLVFDVELVSVADATPKK